MSSAAKVGAFMVAVLVILGYFILKIEDLKLHEAAKTQKVTAIFDSVAGLENKSTVRVAGVRVGKVTEINLGSDGKAHVTLEIDKDVQLHTNATAKVANLGLLGEKYVEVDLGTQSTPLIPAESEHIVLRGQQPASIDDVTNQISAIATDVKAITASLRTVMAGPTGEQRLQDIVENVRQITAQMRSLIDANRTNVDASLKNIQAITADLRVEIPKIAASIDRVANTMGGTVSENRTDVRGIVENLRKLSTDLQTTTQNLNSITGQIKSGEGTVGRLIYSNEAHDKLATALTSVESGVTELKNTLGRANRIGLDIGIHSEYYAGLKPDQSANPVNPGGSSRASVGLHLIPNPERNRFYNIELSDDPRGRRRDQVFEEIVTDASGHTTTTTTHQIRFDRNFVVSAQAGWKLDDLGLRLGLFDSTGGVGADYKYNDRISISGEVFDFGKKRDPNPHLRVYGEYTIRNETKIFPRLFVSTGVDNAFNSKNKAFTFGGGIRWRDDDLKYLLGSVPLK
jgi:phospholipid/cholesterol/gamma-HCH transport system substrate-binding protein